MKTNRLSSIAFAVAILLGASSYQAQGQTPIKGTKNADNSARAGGEIQLSNLLAQARPASRAGFALMPSSSYANPSGLALSITPMAAGPNLPVIGKGTNGRLTKWTGFTSSNSFIGDSTIFESKDGRVGIGTDNPYLRAKLSVVGTPSYSSFGGDGVAGKGGYSYNFLGGYGVGGVGGDSALGPGSIGVAGFGGVSNTKNGGHGMLAVGAATPGAGNSGGIGIVAFGGLGFDGATNGLAGKFNGDVEITGTLSKGGGSFKIDHPLDPENRYLYHSFVESPDMMNIYNGNVVTDDNGEAAITLPAYFEALNRDFRYQLTVIGTFAQAIVADEIKGNRFVIRTSAPGVKVSWQVTGIRQDGWANNNRIPVEVEKSERERGYYLHPEAFNQPEERGIGWARDPEMMQQLRLRRVEAERKLMQSRRQR